MLLASLTTGPDHPDAAVLDAAVDTWSRGGLVAFATETVYGLGGIATDVASVGRIFEAKGRPAINPLIVHVASIAQARDCVAEWPIGGGVPGHTVLGPGPLTLVLNRAEIIPDLVTAGKGTVAVRVPAGKVALGLIDRLGLPISAPSANRSNRLSPTRAEHVLADLDGRIDLIIDSGPTAIGLESTVLDLTTTPPRLLRPGPITRRDLEEALDGERVEEHTPGESIERPLSPGAEMAVHYAPANARISHRFTSGARTGSSFGKRSGASRDRRAGRIVPPLGLPRDSTWNRPSRPLDYFTTFSIVATRSAGNRSS